MILEDIDSALDNLFGLDVQKVAPGSWQVEREQMRLLVLCSEDRSWLRILVPIIAAQEAQMVLEQLLEQNFDNTQETRYALHQGVLWGVFQHSLESLTTFDFIVAVERLMLIYQRGLSDSFDRLIESRIHHIIQTSKRQGQSLEATLQLLDRFYEEGLMGEMDAGADSRETMLAAWQYQLQRLWNQVAP